MSENKKKIIFYVCSIIFLFLIVIVAIANFTVAPFIKSIEKSESKRFNDQVIININVGNYWYKLSKTTWCLLTLDDKVPSPYDNGWTQAVNGYCSFSVENGNYKIYVKDNYGNVSDKIREDVNLSKVINIKPLKENIYLYKGQNDQILYDLDTVGDKSGKISFRSSDSSIVSVSDDGKINGLDYGVATITLESGKVSSSIKVYVSSFINKPEINLKKDYLGCKQFTEEEAKLIDNILFDRINDAGYKTRAGVVEAARFLTLEFAYRVHYFFENGRLENYSPYLHVDGEGRYYHRGLYLSESKYKYLETTFEGPAMWGCNLRNYTTQAQWVYGKFYPNGLDCSGFVTWALLNGGFDIGDIGAGESAIHDDLDDIGPKKYITNELMNSGIVKAGDLIGLNGHMAILAGFDDDNYYIAESLDTTLGVVMTVVKKGDLVNNSIYKYIILMDSIYEKDGNYTEMW